jgi:GNAT superfamily N-acetyltransferase
MLIPTYAPAVIRRATTSDAAAIARVQAETWRAAYAGILPDSVLDAMSVSAGASRWEGHIANDGVAVWVAGDVDAFASAGPSRDEDRHGTTELYALYVHPRAQRRGLGAALLGAAIEHGATTLWVLADNAAGRAFYEACGWSADGTYRTIDLFGAQAGEVRYATFGPFAR